MSDESRTQARTAAAGQLAGEAAEERMVAELAEWARAEGLQMTGGG